MSTVRANNYYDASGGSNAQLYGTSMRSGGTAFVNRIINGNMAINQRASSSYTANGYTLDRWKVFNSGGTYTLSQQTYPQGSQPAFGLTNFMRVTRSSPSAILYLSQLIEDVALFDNIVVTVSFYARATGAVSVPLRVMQEFGSGGSSGVNCGSVSHSLTTTVQRFSGTYTLPSLSGKTIGTGSHLEVTFDIPATTETIEISGVQVEVGSVASAFESRHIETELALCQRYFVRFGDPTDAFTMYGSLTVAGTGVAYGAIQGFSMRAQPTITYASLALATSTGVAITALSTYGGRVTGVVPIQANVASGLTIGQSVFIQQNNTASGFLAMSAEL